MYNEQSVPKGAPLKIVDVQSFIGLLNAAADRRRTQCLDEDRRYVGKTSGKEMECKP